MSTTDQEWDDEIMRQNAALIAEAEKSHSIKMHVAEKFQECARWIAEQYPVADDGTRPMSPSVGELFTQLRIMGRELRASKEQVALLGQAVEKFQIELPDWAENSNKETE